MPLARGAPIPTANAARLFMATAVSYFLLYEWLHFSCHCAKTSWIGRIGDWLFGSLHRGPARHR